MKIWKQFFANSQFLGNSLIHCPILEHLSQNVRFLECGHPINYSMRFSIVISKKCFIDLKPIFDRL